MTQSKFKLPAKIASYVKQLEIIYKKNAEKNLHYVVRNSFVFIQEETSYDNWNGGMSGHQVIFFIDEETLGNIGGFDAKKQICQKIKADLEQCAEGLSGEFIEKVIIELFDENDQECKKATNFFNQPVIDPDAIGIWKQGFLRVFISHRDTYKKQAKKLGDFLERYEMSSFVAHDTIEPMEKWSEIIKKALQTMEVMVLFITDGFFESLWTNQEIGFALAKGIPIVSLKLDSQDPLGFINEFQAVKGNINALDESFLKLSQVLIKRMKRKDIFHQSTIKSFIASKNYNDAMEGLELLKGLITLSEDEIKQVLTGFSQNSQLHNSYVIRRDLPRFLSDITGARYDVTSWESKRIEKLSDNMG